MGLSEERKSEIIDKANSILSEFPDEDRLDVTRLATREGFNVVNADFPEELNIGALMVANDSKPVLRDYYRVIAVDDKISKEQYRYNIAHELGHYYLHGSGEFAKNNSDDIKEQEADFFARNLLMPKKKVEDIIGLVGDTKDTIIDMMMARFNVTKKKAAIRYEELCPCPQ